MNIGLEIRWLDEVDSTNSEVLRHIQDYDNLSVVAAVNQSAGRGQRGNSWHARTGENLTFSMLLKYGPGSLEPLRASRQFLLTQAASLGVSDYIGSKGIDSRIKWPNDIYVRSRKICGMLIENILDGEYLSSSVIGIGLNVNQSDFPPQLVNPTSMKKVTGIGYDLKDELRDLCGYIVRRLPLPLQPSDEGRGAAWTDLVSDYTGRLYRFGEWHDFANCLSDEIFEGKIVGVTDLGRLLIKTRKGEIKEFAFKEISYII